MDHTLFSDLVSTDAAPAPWACLCGGCAPEGAGGNTPGDYGTTPADNTYRYVENGQTQASGSVAPLMAGSKWTSVDAATQKTVVTFSFADPLSSVFKYAGGETYAATLKTFSEVDRTLTRELLAKIAAVCNIQFVEVADNADQCGVLRYGYSAQPSKMNYAGFAFYPSASAIGGDVWIDAGQAAPEWDFYRPNLLLHETLHALGLKHPFSGADVMAADQNIIPNTVMSYSPVAGSSSGTLSSYPAEPMVYDIAALQYLYGAAASNAGDTTYNLASASFQSGFRTLWDAAGSDTLDASGLARGAVLDLNAGAQSDVGRPVSAQALRADGTSSTTQYTATVTLAQGTVIENAVGSAYNDRFIGNTAANAIDGGAGTDTLMVTGAKARFEIVRNGATATVRDTTGATATDRLTNVERVLFNDGAVALDIDGNAGTAAKLIGALYGASAVGNTKQAGTMLSLVDSVGGVQAAQQVLDSRLGANASSAAVVDLLFTNLLGRNASGEEHGLVDCLVDQYGAAPLTLAAAALPVNLELVGLSALGTTGLAYAA